MVDFPYTFNYNGERFYITKSHYDVGERTALWIECANGEPYAVLTTNIPHIKLWEGEFLVKTWGENEDIANCIRDLGIFLDTGKRFKTGYVVGEVWRLKE